MVQVHHFICVDYDSSVFCRLSFPMAFALPTLYLSLSLSSAACPRPQGHKLRLAMRLADLGFLQKAYDYVRSAQAEVRRDKESKEQSKS